jgi:protein-disulfide isomerase
MNAGETTATRRELLAQMALALCGLCGSVSLKGQSLRLITADGQKEILNNTGPETTGAVGKDVSIVEYFDYNCPYCKKLAPDLKSLLAQDPKVALIYKEWPILSEVSVYAARSALAAQWQAKYLVAHDALMNGPKLPDATAVDQALKRAGIDIATLKKDSVRHAADIDALLSRTDAEAHALSLRGTPGIIIGRLLLPGVVNLDGLKQLLAEARQAPA